MHAVSGISKQISNKIEFFEKGGKDENNYDI